MALSVCTAMVKEGKRNRASRMAGGNENYAGFLLRTQEQDQGWYRAYDLEGKHCLSLSNGLGILFMNRNHQRERPLLLDRAV